MRKKAQTPFLTVFTELEHSCGETGKCCTLDDLSDGHEL